MKKLFIAFQFLTIIPYQVKSPLSDDDIAGSSSAFVIVGLIQGIALFITDYISGIFFHPDLVIGIILLVYFILNGGFHLDGLADTVDAVAIKASGSDEADRKKRLSVMKDSAAGSIGVVAVVFTILLKYLALKNITHFLSFTYYSSLVLMPVFPKWVMVVAMFYGRPAREDGLGRIFINRTGLKEVVISTSLLLLLLIFPLLFLGQRIPGNLSIFYALVIATLFIFCRLSIGFFNTKFGGLTGDTLGAMSEMSEITFLFMVIIWSRLYI